MTRPRSPERGPNATLIERAVGQWSSTTFPDDEVRTIDILTEYPRCATARVSYPSPPGAKSDRAREVRACLGVDGDWQVDMPDLAGLGRVGLDRDAVSSENECLALPRLTSTPPRPSG